MVVRLINLQITWVVHYVCGHLLWSHVSRDGDLFCSGGNLSEIADQITSKPSLNQIKDFHNTDPDFLFCKKHVHYYGFSKQK